MLSQLESLLGDNNGLSGGLIDTQALIASLMPYVYGFFVISILITIFYLVNVVTTWRSHRAVIDMRNILREINERDKARDTPSRSIQ